MARLLIDAALAPPTTGPSTFAPSVAPLSPAPLLQRLSADVFIGLAVGGFLLVGLLLGLACLFNTYIKLEEARQAEAAAGVAAREAPAEATCAMKELQRVTPVIVIQPCREICYGQKEHPQCKEVQISANSTAPPQHPSSSAKVFREGQSMKAFYFVEILQSA
ncbi:g5553 [Coccomyxa elongata]